MFAHSFPALARSRSARAGTMLLGALALQLMACNAGDPVSVEPPPPASYDLLIEARTNGFDELMRVPLSGGAPTPLFAVQRNARHPAPSPDGRRVAYLDMMEDGIWVADLATGARQRVSSGEELDMQPAWSPDGTRLAFVSYRSGGSDIYVVNADGTGLRNIMPDDFPAATYEMQPAWSPDGTRIVFASDREGGRSLFTIRPDGSGLSRITTDATARDDQPSWSPDGTRLVFRRSYSGPGGTAAGIDLVIVRADGSDPQRLSQPGREEWPSWSPDGSSIAFASDRTNAEYRVFTVRPDGQEVVERAGGAAFGRHATYPRWIRR